MTGVNMFRDEVVLSVLLDISHRLLRLEYAIRDPKQLANGELQQPELDDLLASARRLFRGAER